MAGEIESLQMQLAEALDGQLREKKARMAAEEAKLKAEERETNLKGELVRTREEKEQAEKARGQAESGLVSLRTKLAANGFEVRSHAVDTVDCLEEGSMLWRLDALLLKVKRAIYGDCVYSPDALIGGVPFMLLAQELEGKLTICLTNSEIDFAAKVDYTLTLKSVVNSSSRSLVKWFPAPMYAVDYGHRVLWPDVMDPSKGYVNENGQLTIEARIKVICCYKTGISEVFTDPVARLSDVILVVEGEEFRSNKAFLAHFCGYFKTLFFSEKSDKSLDRVEIVVPGLQNFGYVFATFLSLIYPHHKWTERLSADIHTCLDDLLPLAEFFDAPFIFWQCIEFLKKADDYSAGDKLRYSDDYNLTELQHDVLESLKNIAAVTEVIESEYFLFFSVRLQNFLLQKQKSLNESA